MSDVHDLLRISPTIKSYLNSALSSFSDDGLMEDLRGFESELPGSADRGDEDIRLSVAIDRAVEFVDPMRQVVIWRFLNEFPIPARHRGGIIDPLTDQQVLGWAWNDAKPGWMMERPYHSYYSWAYGVMAQEIASQARDALAPIDVTAARSIKRDAASPHTRSQQLRTSPWPERGRTPHSSWTRSSMRA